MKLFETKFGSQVYGIATPFSDVDIGVVAMESPSQIYGLKDATDFPQVKDKENHDIRKFWLKRFLRLCLRGNPNTLEWLYTPEEHIIFCHPAFKEYIIQNRGLFLNYDGLIKSHLGFAKSQVMKMLAFDKKESNRENEIGAKRRALIDAHGYDVKYASHAIRLIFQLTDILEHGTIRLPYKEEVRAELLGIKLGELSRDEFYALYRERVEAINQKIDTAPSISMVPVNHDKIANILKEIYHECW